jgi:hypothetical protein
VVATSWACAVRCEIEIVYREPGLRVDEQIARIMERLTPHTAAIAALTRRLKVEEGGPSAVLEVVRKFKDEPDLPVLPTEADAGAEASDLFGWHLGRDVLDFLQATGAVLDVDEYDMTPDCGDDQNVR